MHKKYEKLTDAIKMITIIIMLSPIVKNEIS